MSCPHASTTTLLWLYEHQDPQHLEHIAACPECQIVVSEHADLMAAIAPAIPNLNPGQTRIEPDANRTPTGRAPYATWGAIGLAVAAAAALWLIAMPPTVPTPDTGMTQEISTQTAMAIDEWMEANVDEDLDTLDDELNNLSIELLTL